MVAGAQLISLFSMEAPPMGWLHPHASWLFHFQLNLSGNMGSQTHLEVCFHGDWIGNAVGLIMNINHLKDKAVDWQIRQQTGLTAGLGGGQGEGQSER